MAAHLRAVRLGYRVLIAASAALLMADQQRDPIGLLLTDVDMPV